MQTLTVTDRLYGTETIDTPVLLELIESQPMQRLKKITQYGVPDKYNASFIKNFTRYEHSIGTMILLKRLQANEEEQIAGLLHDASHTAFSHVIDWVVGSTEKQDYQDNQHENIITGSNIATILRKYNYDPERIAQYKNFTLLEQPVPNACADRVDYGMREFPMIAVKQCLPMLSINNGVIIFTDKHAAKVFALQYLSIQENLWSNNESAIRYLFFAKALKLAMKKKIITFADFSTNDEIILGKIDKAHDEEITQVFSFMQKTPLLRELPMSDKILPKKFRYVDPIILVNSKPVRLSAIDHEWDTEIARARKDNKKGVPIPQFLHE